MIKVYGDILSGNCYKIKLLLSFLNIEHLWIHIDILNDETHTHDFTLMNPNAKIPAIELEDGKFLWESNAILQYLALHSCYLPESEYEKALVLQWQFFEQYSHEPYIATARYINKYLGLPDERLDEYKAKQSGGHKALSVMEQRLSESPFLVGETPTIADITLYAYTHVAHEGGFDLTPYHHILRWFKDIESITGYIPMSTSSQ